MSALMALPAISFHALIAATGSKEGARARFQSLIAQLVRLQNPTVRQIEPHPGDWGIDCFVGQLVGLVAVWQAKFFIDGVAAEQQADIRESFETVVTKARERGFTVSAWTLCIPVSLDPRATQWWDAWKQEKEKLHDIKIALWDQTTLEGLLLAPDAIDVRANYFGSSAAVELPELPTLPLPSDLSYEEMLFIKQLRAASITEMESAKQQFFNADLMSREVGDKGIDSELQELRTCLAEVHALWETRFNEKCEEHNGSDLLPGLYPGVMKAIEEVHRGKRSRSLPMGLVHRLGTVHQVVEQGSAGWIRRFRDIAVAHSVEKNAD